MHWVRRAAALGMVIGGPLVCAPPVLAASDIITANDIDKILEIARGYGTARKAGGGNEDPYITGKLSGINYSIDFYGCNDKHEGCTSIQFHAGWDVTDVPADRLAKWNSENRFGSAYLDSDGAPVMEMDVNLDQGVTADNFDDTFDIWRIIVEDFRDVAINNKPSSN
jgi:hypothetical protein